MKILIIILTILFLILTGLFVWTRVQVAEIEAKFPPAGEFAPLSGGRFHYVDVPGSDAMPTLLFVHGASGNLNDQRGAYERALAGEARMIFIDRPGHGYSDLTGATDPAKQADRYNELLNTLGIENVIVVCHSLGCASSAALAVLHPGKVAGLVFVAPATHEWPGGVTWYYDVASTPVIGWVFTETLTLPFGRLGLQEGITSVFGPSEAPSDYAKVSALELVFRPEIFRNNAWDVSTLKSFVTKFSLHYKGIKVPTEIITGDTDDVVLPEIHSVGLERDIDGARLTVLSGVGHKPDYVATDVVVKAIKSVAAQSSER
ncbi:MAG: alpha/beta fold hydrolase [Rhizobiaceae bacterium]